MTKLQRTTFETSRAAEYFDARQLSALVGVSEGEFASVCLKELVDNALDACETAGVAPEVEVAVEDNPRGYVMLTVRDNGPGIPPRLVPKVLDYNVRVSDKAAYRSPTRGAQGNALKTIVGIPYALGGRGSTVVIDARGVRHTIAPEVDPAGMVHIRHDLQTSIRDTNGKAGMFVELAIPKRVQRLDALHWVRSFAAFNPHATFRYQGNQDFSEHAEIYKSTHEGAFKKYMPSQPTSPHWYSAESLKVLVFSHIGHARRGGRDLPLGEFVRQFQGLTSTAKARAVVKQMGEGFTHLSDFADNAPKVADLLRAMQAATREPKASALGYVGEDHYRTFFERVYDSVLEHKYVRRSSTLPSGLPFTFEFALATLEEPGHLYCGINYSPTFGDPLEGTTLAGPEFRARGIQGFLSQAYALPQKESAWYKTPASVAVAAHIITPAPIFLDRGKTRLNMEGA
jgi:DNA topoisomerase VI subunit B